MKKIVTSRNILLLTIIVGTFGFGGMSSAAGPCASENVRWATSSNRIYVTGDVECTLTEIKTLGSKSMPLELIDPTEKIWFLGADMFIQDGAKLVMRGALFDGDVNELRLKSNNAIGINNFVRIRADWGAISINGVKVTSWDENVGGPDTEYANYGRAYIQVRSYLDKDGVTPKESRMDIKNSDIGYLGYAGSEAYGLSWKVLGSTSSDKTVFDVVGVYGDVVDNKIHHNYFGAYTYGAQAMTFVNNEVYESILYGIDPHDDSDYLLIDNNYVHNNGTHGIICSQRCNNLTITNNNSSYNGGNGIMLHRNTNDSLVQDNELYSNVDSGLAVFDSHNNQISGNTAKFNNRGIRFSVGSSDNTIEHNNFSENSVFGIYFYKGSDIPTSGDGRVKLNTFRNNTVDKNGVSAARIREADSNIFEGNSFAGNGSYAIYIEDADSNIFEENTLTGNKLNYYYAKRDAVNTIQDSDLFAVKIGDALSSMTISDSANTIFENSKNLPTNTYPSYSSIVLDQAIVGKSVVQFSKLNFTATPSADSLTIKTFTWNTSGDFYKKWKATNGAGGAMSASYVVGDLDTGVSYDVIVSGTPWSTFVANSDGKIDFTYSVSLWTSKTFEVKESL